MMGAEQFQPDWQPNGESMGLAPFLEKVQILPARR